MDNLRDFREGNGGNGAANESPYPDTILDGEDEAVMDSQPDIGDDERRMHVRAYHYWVNLLGNRTFPTIEDLDPGSIEDFGAHSVLLDFTAGMENPAIPFIGKALREECDLQHSVRYLAEVPGRTLLSRITDHYLQIIANRAPIGFEAEFVNHRGATILYRGILLPFSTDDDTIDFIYGVLNWKEMADKATTDALLSQAGPALRKADYGSAMPEWADGPDDLYGDLSHLGGGSAAMPVADWAHPNDFGDSSEIGVAAYETPDANAGLADWLAFARAGVEDASHHEDRSRASLYDAIGRAYDFALVARQQPDDYEALLTEAGIAIQARAPMTPVVKLVFGARYDKTRLAEYATVLSYAMRNTVPRGGLADLLRSHGGGLKGIVQDERAARRTKALTGKAPGKADRARSIMRLAPAKSLASIDPGTGEFVVLLARRGETGELGFVAALDDQDRLAEQLLCKAADQARPA